MSSIPPGDAGNSQLPGTGLPDSQPQSAPMQAPPPPAAAPPPPPGPPQAISPFPTQQVANPFPMPSAAPAPPASTQIIDVTPQNLPPDADVQPISFSSSVNVDGERPDAIALRESNQSEELAVRSNSRSWSNKAEDVFDAEDVSHPMLRIAQLTTPEVATNNAKLGDFLLRGSAPIREVTLIPVGATKARAYKKDSGRTTVCSSPNAKFGTGIGVTDQNPNGDCSKCPYAEWQGLQPNRTPPACDLIYSYVMWSVEHDQLVVFELKKTSVQAGKGMNAAIVQKGFGNVVVHISTTNQQNANKQTYAVPIITVARIANEEELCARARQMST